MRSVVLFSGGLDSTVLLYRELNIRRDVFAVTFDYGQLHAEREVQAAGHIGKKTKCDPRSVKLPPTMITPSALTGHGEIPKGIHYTDPRQAATVVPNRNLILLMLAAGIAKSHECGIVLFGAHAGDAAVYEDCRPEFVEAVDRLIGATFGVRVVAPFLGFTKRDIVRLGRELGAPLDVTWSCYDPQDDEPCRQCGACVEREEALRV